jgi:hypothetical protein
MPKRRVKHIPWELLSERMVITPSMERRTRRLHAASSAEVLAQYDPSAETQDVFYSVPGAALAAFNLERLEDAEALAQRSLSLAPEFVGSWNHGNAIHAGHTVLGLVALRRGDTARAAAELQASANHAGSPQLASFGPSMQLAKELLRHGLMAEVLDYLGQCRSFWRHGELWLHIWSQKVRRGVVPNFVVHAYR